MTHLFLLPVRAPREKITSNMTHYKVAIRVLDERNYIAIRFVDVLIYC